MLPEFENILNTVLKQDASDLHIAVGKRPMLRIDGVLVPIASEQLTDSKKAEEFAFSILDPIQKDRFLKEREIDFAYSFNDKARFRVNIFFQRGFISIAMRYVMTKIRTIDELLLPSYLHHFTKKKQGFFLVVGPAGHGKSTTLASMINEINHERGAHIITIEDPVEYQFVADKAIIDQREVGYDTLSFSRALKSVLRQDPDVIMIGEMRDAETISAAITTAETGHLVFSTLHTNNVAQTIDRIIDTFPSSQQNQIRAQLSSSLIGILSKRLVPRMEGGRIAACELMVANSAVRTLIRENKTHQLNTVIDTGMEDGMISLNHSLADLVRRREITLESAESYSLNPSDLRMSI